MFALVGLGGIGLDGLGLIDSLFLYVKFGVVVFIVLLRLLLLL